MTFRITNRAEHFSWQPFVRAHRGNVGAIKYIGVTCLVVFLVWGLFFGGFSLILSLIFHVNANTVRVQVQTNDPLARTVFSPAGASLKCWDKATGIWLGALSEDTSHDGKWDGAFPALVDSVIVIKVEDSGSTYYTEVVERLVPAGAAGIERIGILDPINVYPRSATSASDFTGTLMSGGAEVDNTTNIATGEHDIEVQITAASGKQWGGFAYTDPLNGDPYIGTFLVFDLTTTTARMTLTSAQLWKHFSIGAHEYWILKIPPVVNDPQLTTDGTYICHVVVNNLVAATDALDIGAYTNAIERNVLATSFGTSDIAKATNWLDIHLA